MTWSSSASRKEERRTWLKLTRTNDSPVQGSCSEDTLNTLFHSYGSLKKSCFMLHHRSISRMIASTPRPEPIGFCVNVWHFPSRWWCQLACHYLDIPILFSLIQALKSMARNTATRCWDNSCCQPISLCLVIYSPSRRTVLQPTKPVRLLRCCQQRHPTSSAHRIGHRTDQISIRWTTRFGRFCTNESTAPRSVTSTIWKNDWLKSGVDLIRTLLTRAVNQWRDRLRKCVRTKGGHLEHLI